MVRSTEIVLVNFSPRYVRSDDALVVRFGYRVWYPEVQETSYDVMCAQHDPSFHILT